MLFLFTINDLPFLFSHRLPVLLALRDLGFEVVVAGPYHADSVKRLRLHGFGYVTWRVNRSSLSLTGELRSLAQLWRIYRRLRPVLAHHVTPKPVIYGGIVARLAGVSRRVNAISGLGTLFSAVGRTSLRRRLATVAHGLAHRGPGTRVIFQNPDDLQALLSARCVIPGRCRMIPGSGVDPDVWHPATSPPAAPVITVACRMLYDKGVADCVAAAQRLRAAGVPIDLHLAGGVDLANPRAIPESVLRDWQAQGAARWLGFVADMHSLWKKTRIACMPSYYGEGIPKTLIEAASCGLPIVTCDVPGCREIVQHGVNGLLVPPMDSQALATALQSLLSDPDLCARMGAAGRQMVIERFSLKLVIDLHLDIYQELLGPLWPSDA